MVRLPNNDDSIANHYANTPPTTIPLRQHPRPRRFHYANTPTHADSITPPTPPPTTISLRQLPLCDSLEMDFNFQFVISLEMDFNFQFVISLEMDLFVAISKSGSWFHLKLWWPWTGHYFLLVLQLPKQGLV